MKNTSYALFVFLACLTLLVGCGSKVTEEAQVVVEPAETTESPEQVTEVASEDEIEDATDVEDVEEDITLDETEDDYGDIV